MKILFLAVVCAAMCGGGYSMSIDPGDENIIWAEKQIFSDLITTKWTSYMQMQQRIWNSTSEMISPSHWGTFGKYHSSRNFWKLGFMLLKSWIVK